MTQNPAIFRYRLRRPLRSKSFVDQEGFEDQESYRMASPQTHSLTIALWCSNLFKAMGKEYILEMQARQEGKRGLELCQHFNDISVLGVYAQRKYRGQDLPEGWGQIESHILECEECQYDVSAAMDAMRTEDEAMMEVLFPANS